MLGPYSLGSILGPPDSWKLPYPVQTLRFHRVAIHVFSFSALSASDFTNGL